MILESPHLLQPVLESGPDASAVLTVQGEVRAWSCLAERLFGWKESDVIGRNFFDLAFQGIVPPSWKEQKTRFGCKVISLRGEELRIEMTVFRLRKSVSSSFFIFFRDFTEDYRQQLKFKEEIRFKDDFIATASHELKNPLTSLRLQVQVFKMLSQSKVNLSFLNSRLEVILANMERQIDRLCVLVKSFLECSKACSKAMDLHIQSADLVSVARSAIQSLSFPSPSKDVLTIHLTAERIIHGEWDVVLIEQAILNLLTNAIKFGEGKPVFVELFVKEDTAVIKVKDQGIGISPENQQKIFERFHRVQTAAWVEGVGLGLYIVSQIVSAHRGKISVESKLGQGSVFTVELPLKRDVCSLG